MSIKTSNPSNQVSEVQYSPAVDSVAVEPISARITYHLKLSRFDALVLSFIALLIVAIGVSVAVANVAKPGMRVAYLAPSDGKVQNIWMADPADPANAQQVTFSPDGIYNFDVSPDGRFIAFAERNNNTGTTELKQLDLRTGALQQLTNCATVDADCKTPTWRPDGKVIAYERTELNSNLNGGATSPVRVWLLDLTTNPISTRPLFTDSQTLGYSPEWSGDGNRIAVFDSASGGVLVYDFRTGSAQSIPSRYGSTGALSPNGEQVVFPDMTRKGEQMYANLKIADLASKQFTDLTNPDDPINDTGAVWNPDGTKLAIARQYIDDRWTRGPQVYLLDPNTKAIQPLVVDKRYSSSFFEWSPDGTQLLMQRFPELTETGEENQNGRPEIWTYDLSSHALSKIVVNAFLPRWVPNGR